MRANLKSPSSKLRSKSKDKEGLRVEENGQRETGVQGIKVVNGASPSVGLETTLTVQPGSAGLSCRQFRQPDPSGPGNRAAQGETPKTAPWKTHQSCTRWGGAPGVPSVPRPGFKTAERAANTAKGPDPVLDASQTIGEAKEKRRGMEKKWTGTGSAGEMGG